METVRHLRSLRMLRDVDWLSVTDVSGLHACGNPRLLVPYFRLFLWRLSTPDRLAPRAAVRLARPLFRPLLYQTVLYNTHSREHRREPEAVRGVYHVRDIVLALSWRPKIIRTASLPPSVLRQWRGMLSGTGALYPSLRRVPHFP